MNHAGEIRTLVSLAEPDVRVWTNVGDAHIGFFGSRDAIADAKAEILESPTPGALVVANADDALVMARVGRWTGRAPDVRQRRRRRRPRGARRRSRIRRHDRARLESPRAPLICTCRSPVGSSS